MVYCGELELLFPTLVSRTAILPLLNDSISKQCVKKTTTKNQKNKRHIKSINDHPDYQQSATEVMCRSIEGMARGGGGGDAFALKKKSWTGALLKILN